LLPARRAQAPAITGFQAREAGGRNRCRQIVAGGFREGQEVGVDMGADGVDAEILRPGLAAAGAVEPGQRVRAALGERLPAEPGWPRTPGPPPGPKRTRRDGGG